MRRILTTTGVLLTVTACGSVQGATQSPATAAPASTMPKSTTPASTVPGPALTGGPMPAPRAVVGQDRLLLLCQLNGSRDAEAALCATALEVARSLTARPVEMIATGDPAVVQPGATTLLLQGAIQATGGSSLLLLSARTDRAGGPMGELFGPAPRAVPLDGDLAAAARPALRDLFRPLLGQSNTTTQTGD